jgi:NitT/TauT family transport system permease protein
VLGDQVVTAVGMVVLLALWEAVVRLFKIAPYLLPAPSEIILTIVKYHQVLLADTLVTLWEIILGFVAGSVIGLLLAIGILFSRVIERVVYPPAIVTQIVPKLAIAPLFVVWFGVGLQPKVLITALMCLFPVLINAAIGLRAVDQRILDLMHSLSASRWQIFVKVQFPNAAAYIFAGLKIGITMAVVGAIVGEWMGSDHGLGHQILMANSQLRTDLLFAALVMLSLLGVGLFGLMLAIERLLLPRHKQVDVLDKM